MIITARRTVDYRTVTGLIALLFFLLILIPPFGSPRYWLLSLMGLGVIFIVFYRQVGDRIRFSDEQVEYLSPLGRVVSSWPLDGSSRVHFDDIVTQSRWGRAVRGSLVISAPHGVALALMTGRYTKERQWSEFLLDQEREGRLVISEDAKLRLQKMFGS